MDGAASQTLDGATGQTLDGAAAGQTFKLDDAAAASQTLDGAASQTWGGAASQTLDGAASHFPAGTASGGIGAGSTGRTAGSAVLPAWPVRGAEARRRGAASSCPESGSTPAQLYRRGQQASHWHPHAHQPDQDDKTGHGAIATRKQARPRQYAHGRPPTHQPRMITSAPAQAEAADCTSHCGGKPAPTLLRIRR